MGRKGDELKKKKRKNSTRYIHSCHVDPLSASVLREWIDM